MNRSLTSLGLGHSAIADGGAAAIAETLKACTALSPPSLLVRWELDVQGNRTLIFIRLNHNEIGAVGAAVISDALKVARCGLLNGMSLNAGEPRSHKSRPLCQQSRDSWRSRDW